MSWTVSGHYVESCNCEAACPCIFLSPPTTGECTALLAWHVETGTHEGTDVGGLNVAMAVHAPGHMLEVPWDAALYLDQRASEEQAAALGAVFSGAAGGHPSVLAGHVGEVLGVASAAIEVEVDGDTRHLRIGEVGAFSISAAAGADGGQVRVRNHPLAVAPGEDAVVARAEHLRYADHGLAWDLSGRNGLYSAFAYAG